MEQFIQRHRDFIDHVLSGFDRVLFRGTLRSISYLREMETFLSANHVLLKDLGEFVKRESALIKEHAEQYAGSIPALGTRKIKHLGDSALSAFLLLKKGVVRNLCLRSAFLPHSTAIVPQEGSTILLKSLSSFWVHYT